MGAPDAGERAVLETLQQTLYRREPDVVLRLACQACPHGDVRIEPRRRPERIDTCGEAGVGPDADDEDHTKPGSRTW